MTTDPIQRLREMMERHRAAVITRQSMEDDDPQRYEDACDMEDEAEEKLCNALRNLAPALVEVVEAARDVLAPVTSDDEQRPNALGDRLTKLGKALAALDGKGNQ